MSNIPSLTLNTNASMPLLGLGVYKATAPGEVEGAIATALDLGYRLIDTASAYKNEEGVGRGIRSSSVPRKELFITTKLWNTAQRIGDIDGAFQRSLDRLGLDYVDLYLIHWPVPGCFINSWQALERIRESGQAKAIGVSNFEISHLEALFQTSGIVPAVNQIEYHPLWNQSDLYEYCKERGIAVQAYAPLARGAYLKKDFQLEAPQTPRCPLRSRSLRPGSCPHGCCRCVPRKSASSQPGNMRPLRPEIRLSPFWYPDFRPG